MDPLQGLREPLYLHNVSILKQIGNDYKITQIKTLRNKGVELDNYVPKNTINNQKLFNNIVRAKTTVKEYGLCNPWTFFLTLTISPAYFNRYNLKDFHKILVQWFRDYRKKYHIDLKYLLIPEKHKDGAWHLHGFIYGLPLEHLKMFSLSDYLPTYILDKIKRGETVYNWPSYADKFGFVVIEPIRNKDKATSYITKYITKDLARSVDELGSHLYYASQKLNKATELKRGTLLYSLNADFENEYCKIKNFDGDFYSPQHLKNFILAKNEILLGEEYEDISSY